MRLKQNRRTIIKIRSGILLINRLALMIEKIAVNYPSLLTRRL